jgi:methionyl aminopeptidase
MNDLLDTESDASINTGAIKIHGPDAFESMRKAGRLAAKTLDFITSKVEPGVTTNELNRLCHNFTLERGGLSAPLNYRGFSKSICTSINHVVCHGIPNDKPLRKGDIVNIDVTVVVNGWHGDSSRMFLVGDVSRKARRLVDVTYESLRRGMEAVRPGATFGDVGYAIQSYAESERCSVVRDFCGHGIGQVFHDAPNVLHYGSPGTGLEIKEGMIFTIEPMINLGKHMVKLLDDGWTAVTKDRSLTAQFEHCVGVTANGCEIFTQSLSGKTHPPYD